MISFIHIGKCGGTSINSMLRKQLNKYKEYHMNKEYNNNEKYIIWIRNPLTRFVSSFNMIKTMINYRFTKKDIPNININNCVAPVIIKNYLKNNKRYLYSIKYDSLVKYFKSANHLAESLSSTNISLQKNALDIMNSSYGHTYKGIGWYLNNGKFIKKRNNKILFVGKLETINSDIILLEKKLKIKFSRIFYIRKNNSILSKYLSPLAIRNIINFYKNTDYKALEELHNYGWISKEILDSYYKYPIV